MHINWLLLVTSSLLIFGGATWQMVSAIHELRLMRRIRGEAVPHPTEVWWRIIWKRPGRQFLPPLMQAVGMMLIFNSVSFDSTASTEVKNDHEMTRLLANIISPIGIAVILHANWRSWKRYRNEKGEH